MRKKLAALLMTGAIAFAPMQPAHALFGFGDIVFDPSNYAENVLTAARTLEQINNQIQQLLNEAQNIAYQVSEIETAFNEQYGEAAASGDFADMIASAEARWHNSVAGYEDALKVQAGVVGNIERTRSELSNLVAQSQGATGALQAAQAGNQLLALQSQQMTDLTAAIAAQNRADALDAARRASAEAQARENLNRFLDYGTAYVPTTVTMFR